MLILDDLGTETVHRISLKQLPTRSGCTLQCKGGASHLFTSATVQTVQRLVEQQLVK